MKTTILGGLLFLAPLAVAAILLNKIFELSLLVAAPIDKAISLETFWGVASVNLLAIVLIVFLCFAAGLLARWAFLGKRLKRLDGILIDFIPSYAVFKTVVTSASASDDLDAMMVPVLVRFDDHEQLAFETERTGDRVVVFLPGAPSAWAGATVVMESTRVMRLNIPAHEATKLLRTFGRGTLAARDAARALTA